MPTPPIDPPVLFCTDTMWSTNGERFTSVAPGLEAVCLRGEEHVADDDLKRVSVAFFSGDAWPERSAHFMQASLQASGLQWLHTFSAGVDHPVFGMFTDRGVQLTTSSGASAAPIAQTALMYLLMLSRGMESWRVAQAEHRWDPRPIVVLDGLTLGVIGMGPIGLEVIRLAETMGMRAIGMRRRVLGHEPCETWELSRLHELAGIADALVLAVPLTTDTRHLVDASVLAAMRPGAWLVNIARGEVVDEDALIDSLRSGHLGGAGLDVFTTEPLPESSALWDLPNVIVTPHSSGTSQRTYQRAVDIFTDNLGRFVAGTPLRNPV